MNTEPCTDSVRDKIKALLKLSKCLRASPKTDELKNILKVFNRTAATMDGCFHSPINQIFKKRKRKTKQRKGNPL